jgi:hypothetical protein
VMLRPPPDVLAQRERDRGTRAYRDWESLDAGVVAFDRHIEASPRIGLWLDPSAQTVDETVDEIVGRLDEALIGN